MARILLVDDSCFNLHLLRTQLESAEFEISEAVSGATALGIAAEVLPDLVILDLVMPGIDGYETLRCLKAAAAARGEFLPVILVTALQDPAARSRGLELGADDVLTKPLDPGELRLRLRNLLRLRQERLALQRSHARVVELQRFKDEMAALLVHDLRNPASAVLANLQYLLGVETLPDHAEALGDAHEACRRMLRLLENLRDVARAEDSHLAPTTAWVEPSTVFEAIIAQRESTCRARGVRLLVDMEPSGRTPIDQDLVTRIIENVFDNAVRYTPRGGTISLATRVVGGTLQVRVGNSGAAIPLADRETVFEKYECLAHARTRKPDGGLGLYFCRLAAEAHGGSIWVEEEPGLPTVFVLALPMNDVGAERSRAAR